VASLLIGTALAERQNSFGTCTKITQAGKEIETAVDCNAVAQKQEQGWNCGESTDNGNWYDGIDNDCDGLADSEDPDCAPACPTIQASLGQGSNDWPSQSSTQNGRLLRNGITNECGIFDGCPGTLGTQFQVYDAYTFEDTGCVTVEFDTGSCGTDIFAAAYQGQYNPSQQCGNYLGDIGSSTSQPFSFTTEGTWTLVVTSVNGPTECDYSFQVNC
jgi:hypothetical protein